MHTVEKSSCKVPKHCLQSEEYIWRVSIPKWGHEHFGTTLFLPGRWGKEDDYYTNVGMKKRRLCQGNGTWNYLMIDNNRGLASNGALHCIYRKERDRE